jgi:ABC-type uncharacterized transport system substrate-binding protein
MRPIALVLAVTLGLTLVPLSPEAQQPAKVWRIGFLGAETASTNRHFLDAFRLGMRERGYVEGQSITIEERWAEGRSERFHDLVAELVQLKMDVIVPISTPAAREAKNFTKTTRLPSVTWKPHGPVAQFAGKWLELLVDTIPQLSRVAILWNPSNPSNASFLKAVQSSSQSFRTTLLLHGVADASQFDSGFRAMADACAQALIVFVDPITVRHRARIVELATKSRLPAIYGFREFADAGGLMAYGPNVAGACRRAAVYVDKVLKGAKPGDLPVEQVTQFEFLINLKTVKALGLTIPQSVLVRADEIIQ